MSAPRETSQPIDIGCYGSGVQRAPVVKHPLILPIGALDQQQYFVDSATVTL